jgi:septal ring factor EnvC (AmiA/AmiB activator)
MGRCGYARLYPCKGEGAAVTEQTENLVLEMLRAIRGDIGGMKEDIREIKHRLTSLGASVAGLRRDNAQLYADVADQHSRYDRLAERVERIERRLDLGADT